MSTINTTLSGQYQNQIKDLPNLNDLRYENIFKVYKTDNNHYYYNILNTVTIPADLDPSAYYYINYNKHTPWTVISYNQYGTTNLWWLIVLANQIRNPLKADDISQIKIIKSEYIRTIINEIHNQLT